MPVNVFTHHSRTRYTRPYDRAGCYQCTVIVAPQLAEQHPHGRRFHIETTHRFAPPDQVADLRIFFKRFKIIDINLYSAVCLDEGSGILDVSQASLTENIQFINTHILGIMHFEMCYRKAFGRQVCGRVGIDRLFGDKHTAGMNGEMRGDAVHPFGIAENQACNMITVTILTRAGYNGIDLRLGEAKHFSKFAHQRPVFESGVCTQQGGMLRCMFIKDIFCYFIPVFP